MPQPLYKYTTPETALSILTYGTFRYSSPVLFNDPFDIQTNCVFKGNPELIHENLVERVKRFIETEIVAEEFIEPWKSTIDKVRHLSRVSPKENTEKFYGLLGEYAKSHFAATIEGLAKDVAIVNHVLDREMRKLRIFCVTENPANLLMWSHYANNHKGVMFEIVDFDTTETETYAIDSVKYEEHPYPMFKISEIIDAMLFGEKALEPPDYKMHVYRKYDIWSYEQEWRVAATVDEDNEQLFFDVPIKEKQVRSIVFGCECEDETVESIMEKGNSIDKQIDYYKAHKLADRYGIGVNKI